MYTDRGMHTNTHVSLCTRQGTAPCQSTTSVQTLACQVATLDTHSTARRYTHAIQMASVCAMSHTDNVTTGDAWSRNDASAPRSTQSFTTRRRTRYPPCAKPCTHLLCSCYCYWHHTHTHTHRGTPSQTQQATHTDCCAQPSTNQLCGKL